MPSLPELQGRLARALLAGPDDPARELDELFAGPVAGATALNVHRNTVLGVLRYALHLSFPSIELLVGEAYFEQCAHDYSRNHPPQVAVLARWGADFPAFVSGQPGTESLPWLKDLARFDWALDDVARQVASEEGGGEHSLLVGPGLALHLPRSLCLFGAEWPVDAIRDAVQMADPDALTRLQDAGPAPLHLALWRRPQGVGVHPLGELAASVLAALLSAHEPAALPELPQGEAAAQLSAQLFRAPFARLQQSG